jgi:hypothetical protein
MLLGSEGFNIFSFDLLSLIQLGIAVSSAIFTITLTAFFACFQQERIRISHENYVHQQNIRTR